MLSLLVVRYIAMMLIFGKMVHSSKDLKEKMSAGNCSAVDTKLSLLAKAVENIQLPIRGEKHQLICSTAHACCSQQTEEILLMNAKLDLNQSLSNKIGNATLFFDRSAVKFDEFFTHLLDSSKRELHSMFVKTYGLLYQQNAHIFTDLFDSLRSYYKGADESLDDALDLFFSSLMQRMFELFNAQHSFTDVYMDCVAEHSNSVKPFDNVPQELSTQVKRSFVAARTFVQALFVGRNVLQNVVKGMSQAQPCNTYCNSVMMSCLSLHQELSVPWQAYIVELLKLAEQLEGPYNIERVVDPIEIRISDAIMNFKQNVKEVTKTIFELCGQPQFDDDEREKRHIRKGRSSRSRIEHRRVEKTTIGPSLSDRTSGRSSERIVGRTTAQPRPSLDSLVHEMRGQIETSKSFWTDIGGNICSAISVPSAGKDIKCWNGTKFGRFAYQQQESSIDLSRNEGWMPVEPVGIPFIGVEQTSRGSSPSITDPAAVQTSRLSSSSIINAQSLQLRLITSKLRSAVVGRGEDDRIGDTVYDNDHGTSGDGSVHEIRGTVFDEENDDLERAGSGSKSWDEEEDDDDGGSDDDEYGEGVRYNRPPSSASISQLLPVYLTSSSSPSRHVTPQHAHRPHHTKRPVDQPTHVDVELSSTAQSYQISLLFLLLVTDTFLFFSSHCPLSHLL